MLKYIDSTKMGRGKLAWLDSYFHFSFSDYYNKDNMNFGVLRVINDDLVQPNSGFDTHHHRDMEIISYIVNGEITHQDSMNNKRILSRGQVQYMSAGTGVYHSEHNFSNEILRLLQIWILPDEKGHTPNYGDYEFSLEERYNKWLCIVTGKQNKNSHAPIRINADINLYATIFSGKNTFKVDGNRQAYLLLVEGNAEINGLKLKARDALEIIEEEVSIFSENEVHILIIEMAKSGFEKLSNQN